MENEALILGRIQRTYNRKLRAIIAKGQVLATSGAPSGWACLTHDGYKELKDEFPELAVAPLGKDYGISKEASGSLGFCNWASFIKHRKGVFYLGINKLVLGGTP